MDLRIAIDFEIFLASLMANKQRVRALLAEAGVDIADVPRIRASEEAAGFWSAPDLAYFGERLPLTGIDDAPVVALAVDPGTRRHRFKLSLWPGFERGVLLGQEGHTLHPHFVRSENRLAALPAPGNLGDLRPWEVTLEEVVTAFGASGTDESWDLVLVGLRPGRERPWGLTFDLGLLQEARTLP